MRKKTRVLTPLKCPKVLEANKTPVLVKKLKRNKYMKFDVDSKRPSFNKYEPVFTKGNLESLGDDDY
jgi:hypothetical protein